MREIRTEDAVGHILCHDITQIIKDLKKGVLFKKGHIIREEDIPLLLSVGKEHLYVWEKKEGILHENEGAQILYEICAGDSEIIHGSDIKEGKIEEARQLQFSALELVDAVFCELSPVPVKHALNLQGWDMGPLRMPLCEMEDANLERLRNAMIQ